MYNITGENEDHNTVYLTGWGDYLYWTEDKTDAKPYTTKKDAEDELDDFRDDQNYGAKIVQAYPIGDVLQNYIFEYENEAEDQNNVQDYHFYSVIATTEEEAEALIRKDDKEKSLLILVEDYVKINHYKTLPTTSTTKGNVIMTEFEANEVNNDRVDDWATANNSK